MKKSTETMELLGSDKITANEIKTALVLRHPGDQWAYFTELRYGTGYGKHVMQSLDGWAIHYYASEHNKKIAYEIKISRTDFLHELKQPRKRVPALMISNEYYFVTPKGMIKPGELPPECGLIEYTVNEPLRTVVAAPWRDTPPLGFNTLAAILRRSTEQETLRAISNVLIKKQQIEHQIEYRQNDLKTLTNKIAELRKTQIELESTVSNMRRELRRSGDEEE